jgi:tetratricopeptide (TPR) repeat protein
MPYIESGNAGMDDMLYEVAYGTCRDKDDWRYFAECLETMGKDSAQIQALRIYRRIGDHEDYLRLRTLNMKYGGDFHDLATFYWERGEKQKAIQVAKEGLKKGEGKMDELRSFLAKRARESGDRQAFLNLEFEQATDQPTLQKYKAIAKICKPQEWVQYEPLILKRLDKAWDGEKLKIFMHRKDFDQALAVLKKMGSPGRRYYNREALNVAQALETRFPREILAYYRSGLGDLKINRTRKEYADQAAEAI